MDFACLAVLVSSGMLIAAWIGWRIGRIMSPRPEFLRQAAARALADDKLRDGRAPQWVGAE